MKDWTLWRGRPPPKRGGKTSHREGASNVEALVPTTTERIDMTLSGVARDERPQRGSGCSGWRTNNGKERNRKNVASTDLERRKK
jgi:hypothetical protein